MHSRNYLTGLGIFVVALAGYWELHSQRASHGTSGSAASMDAAAHTSSPARPADADHSEESFAGYWEDDNTPHIIQDMENPISEASREEAIAAMIEDRQSDESDGSLSTDQVLYQTSLPDLENFISSSHITAYSQALNDPTLEPLDREKIIQAVQRLDRRDYLKEMADQVISKGTDPAIDSLAQSLAKSDAWTSTSTYLDIAREHFDDVRDGSSDDEGSVKWNAFLQSYLKNLPKHESYGLSNETSRISALSSHFREDPNESVSDLAAETLVYLDSPNAISEVVKLLQTTYAAKSEKHDILLDKLFHLSGPRFKAVATQLNQSGKLHESVRSTMELLSANNTASNTSEIEPKFYDIILKAAEGCVPCAKNKE
jgi:hypothetical protein